MDGDVGIKVADGSFYPILEEGFRGRKRLVLTTVQDNQGSVQIDFYRSRQAEIQEGGYVGSLMIENIQAAPKGDPEIEVLIGIDHDGNLNAEARDASTGEHQTLSVSRQDSTGDSEFGIPDFELESTLGTELPEDDELLTGTTYPIEAEDRRRTYMERRRSPLLFILFLILCLAVIGAATYYVYRYFTQRPAADAPGQGASMTVPAEQPAGPAAGMTETTTVTTTNTRPTENAAATPAVPAAVTPTPPAAGTAAANDGVWYLIRRGDTLWDISATYYRNPWFYPRIAKHPRNNIKNPDLILAGFKLFIPRN